MKSAIGEKLEQIADDLDKNFKEEVATIRESVEAVLRTKQQSEAQSEKRKQELRVIKERAEKIVDGIDHLQEQIHI